jgi:hypothetical protein
MKRNESHSWREIAETILHENNPEALSTLVTQLCNAFDSERQTNPRNRSGQRLSEE